MEETIEFASDSRFALPKILPLFNSAYFSGFERPPMLAALCAWLASKFQVFDALAGLDKLIDLLEEAIPTTPDGSLSKPPFLVRFSTLFFRQGDFGAPGGRYNGRWKVSQTGRRCRGAFGGMFRTRFRKVVEVGDLDGERVGVDADLTYGAVAGAGLVFRGLCDPNFDSVRGRT